ncbi:MAG: mannitol dehydrogenase family protein [Sphingomonadales bacterium]|nr:mannitol dehydrogenase family protein [Sphingomonadales bacterium]MDE2170617.1 mannitol dehydrogenase family protein [Sphingomonadales bacterium]
MPQGAARPAYDRTGKAVGILHFGLGAFTRAHQAWYTDRAMELDGGDWMIVGVSMRSSDVAEQLNPQDGLYMLAERSGEGTSLRLIGSIAHVLLAGADRAAIIDHLAAPTTHIVSFTVTEKGYCRSADGRLDQALAERGFYPLLAEGLDRRRQAGLSGLTLMSCDNLADNGHQLRALLRQYLATRDAGLLAWFETHCTTPCTMVDRIVPATTAQDRAWLEGITGLRDEGAVVTEPFSQWVIEDAFAGPRPAWERVGAQIVGDVTPYETAKLRMLNGAHSALAYLGLERGHTFVHEAVADPALRALIERMMLAEAAPTIEAGAGQDLPAYAQALLARFANRALDHRLIQIAMDGSQKIPQRWLATLAIHQRAGRDCPAILTALGAWLRHVRGDVRPVEDPRAADLAAAWARHGEEGVVEAILGKGGLVPSEWRPDVTYAELPMAQGQSARAK